MVHQRAEISERVRVHGWNYERSQVTLQEVQGMKQIALRYQDIADFVDWILPSWLGNISHHTLCRPHLPCFNLEYPGVDGEAWWS